MEFLFLDHIFFEFMGYPMSYLEFFGTLINLSGVILMAKKSILTWPIGIIGVLLFAFMFYQLRLYSDLIEQVYYFVSGFWGWWVWMKYRMVREPEIQASGNKNDFGFSSSKYILTGVLISAFGTLVLYFLVLRLPTWWPELFQLPASFAFIDALTTMASFVAQYLMIHKRAESWLYWVFVNTISVWLYWVKDVKFVSLLYLGFLVLAIYGFFSWTKVRIDSKTSH